MITQLHTPEQAARWLRERVTASLWTDSRKVTDGDGFIAWPGAATDGRKYVGEVLASGARACLVERWGDQVVTDDGADRDRIGAIVFERPDELAWLESVLHPLVGRGATTPRESRSSR